MAGEASKIQNDLNFLKNCKLLLEPCTTLMIKTFIYFYNWHNGIPFAFPDRKVPGNLVSHLGKFPHNQAKVLRKIFAGPGEISKIEEMKIDISNLNGYDITFLYKLIRFGTNSDKLAAPNDDVWNGNCPTALEGELEHLLYLIKNDRNAFNHKEIEILDISDAGINKYFILLIARFTSIIEQIKLKLPDIDPTELDEALKKLIDNVEEIRKLRKIAPLEEKSILSIMMKVDLDPVRLEHERIFSNELRSYCPPHFKCEDSDNIMEVEQLMSLSSQVVIIYAEAGYGKTSLTKYVLRELLTKTHNAGDELSTLDIAIRVACQRAADRNVPEFMLDNIPISRLYLSDSMTLKNFLKKFNVIWIIDGYDEKTDGFIAFFPSFLRTLPSNHMIIITTRLNCRDELVQTVTQNLPDHLKVTNLFINRFDKVQIKKVAERYLGVKKAEQFLSSVVNSLDNKNIKNFIETPINLNLCLELFEADPNSLAGKLTTVYTLYEEIFKKNISFLVERHVGRIANKDNLKIRIHVWFDHFCKETAKILFTWRTGVQFTKQAQTSLNKVALQQGLKGNFCCSTFMDSEISVLTDKKEYFFKHNIQKEVLSFLGLLLFDDDELNELVKGSYHFSLKYLYKCNWTKFQFGRIVGVFLKKSKGFRTAKWMMKLMEDDRACFETVMDDIASSMQPLMLYVLVDDYYMSYVDMDKFNEVISEYKDRIKFELKLKSRQSTKFIYAIRTLIENGNMNLVTEIMFENSEWDKSALKDVFKLKKLEKIEFFIDGKDNSILVYLSSTSIADLSPSLSLDRFHESCHAHFDIKDIKDPSKLLKYLSDISEKFPSMSVALHFDDRNLSQDIDANLLESFLSSTVQVQKLEYKFWSPSEFPFLLQLINSADLESLELDLPISYETKSLSACGKIFDKWDCALQTKLKDVEFRIRHPSPMKAMYDKLSSDILDKTTVVVSLYTDERRNVLKINIPDFKDQKQFQKIELRWHPLISKSEIDSLKLITKSLIDYDDCTIE